MDKIVFCARVYESSRLCEKRRKELRHNIEHPCPIKIQGKMLMNRVASNYIKYGISQDLATSLESKELPLSTFRQTSNKNLIKKYGLDTETISTVKNSICRKPIDNEDLFSLLSNSNYTCNVCKGIKGKSYIIHHIVEYSITQDNSYQNLIVLCPTCHDLAHRNSGLTNRINIDDLNKLKYQWELDVTNHNASITGKEGKINEADYLNIPRITELILESRNNIPEEEYSGFSKEQNFILNNSEVNPDILTFENKLYPFAFVNSHHLRLNAWKAFKPLLTEFNFIDLEDILTKKHVFQNDFIGTYCYYIGGLYGNSPLLPITSSTPICHVYFRKRFFFVEWKIDPKFLTSNTAICRLSERTIYIAYGIIRSVGEKLIKNKKFIHIDIRPYVLGIPSVKKERTPIIKYIKEAEYSEEDYDEDYDEI